MDKFKRAVIPVFVAIVLLVALFSRLASCAPGSTKNGSTPASGSSASSSPSESPGAAVTSSPKVVKPTAPYSDEEIKSIYESLGLAVVEIRDAEAVTMVHYYSPSGVPGEIVSRFDWFDRATGTRDLVYGWAYTDKFEIKPDKSFTVLTTGLSYIDGGQAFPEIFTAHYSNVDGAVMFTGAQAKYYAPLANSYTLGSDRHECLTGIHFNAGMVSLGFGPQAGYEAEFSAASEWIPKMTIKNENGISTITLYKTILSGDFKNSARKDNISSSLISVKSDGTDTVITLKLADNVKRYNVSTQRSPVDDRPYALMEYTTSTVDYPTGW